MGSKSPSDRRWKDGHSVNLVVPLSLQEIPVVAKIPWVFPFTSYPGRTPRPYDLHPSPASSKTPCSLSGRIQSGGWSTVAPVPPPISSPTRTGSPKFGSPGPGGGPRPSQGSSATEFWRVTSPPSSTRPRVEGVVGSGWPKESWTGTGRRGSSGPYHPTESSSYVGHPRPPSGVFGREGPNVWATGADLDPTCSGSGVGGRGVGAQDHLSPRRVG